MCSSLGDIRRKKVLQEWTLLTVKGYNAKRKRPLCQSKGSFTLAFLLQKTHLKMFAKVTVTAP
jgi:hypothetical protein